MSKAYLTPAAKKLAPVKLAHGMRLQHGQIIGSAPTIATAATKPSAEGHAAPVTPGMRSRIDSGFEGAPKNCGAAPTTPGMRSRSGE
jgi:hypothetical protein